QRRGERINQLPEGVPLARAEQIEDDLKSDDAVNQIEDVINDLRDARQASGPLNLGFSRGHFRDGLILQPLAERRHAGLILPVEAVGVTRDLRLHLTAYCPPDGFVLHLAARFINRQFLVFNHTFKYSFVENQSGRDQRLRVSRPRIATKTAEPRIDQMIGNDCPPILTANSSGNPSARAIHIPSSAPMKPMAIEARHPP